MNIQIEDYSVPFVANPVAVLPKATRHGVDWAAAPTPPSAPLILRAEETIRRCRQAGLGHIRPVAIAPPLAQPTYYPLGDQSIVVIPAGADPARTPAGRHPVPSGVRATVRRVHRAGIDFDRVYIAHELHDQPLGDGPVELDLSKARALVPPPPPTQMALVAHDALDRFYRFASGVVQSTARRVTEISTLVGGFVAPVRGLDPIIFAVLTDGPTEGIWFGVAYWVW